MSAGEHLDIAAANMAKALGLARHRRDASTGEQMSIAVARTRFYQELRRQLMLIAAPDESRWDPHLVQFGQSLRGLTAHADRAFPDGPPQVPVRGPVGKALHEAATALTAANDVLEAHLGDRSTPRSPEGVALSAGHRQADNLAATGRLAAAALKLDERFRTDRWLNPPPIVSPPRDLLGAVARDVRGEWSVVSWSTASKVERGGVEARGFVRGFAPIPSIGAPTLWATVSNAGHAVAATDAARLFVFEYGGRVTTEEMVAVARACGRIAVDLADVLAHTGTPVRGLAATRHEAASQWEQVARSAGGLRVDASDGAPPALPVASTALQAVASWLDDRLRTDLELRSTPLTAGTERRTAAWRRVAGEIAVRLGDVAEHLRNAADIAQTELRVYRPARSAPEIGRVIQTGKWLVASTTNPQFSTLLHSLRDVQKPLSTLADMADVRMLPGPREVAHTAALRRLQTHVAANSPTTRRTAMGATAAGRPTGATTTGAAWPTQRGGWTGSPPQPRGGR